MRLSDQHAAAAEGLRQLELAALPTGKEWKTWWNEWQHHMEMKFGWERAIVDAVTRLIRNQLTLARIIRNTGAGRMAVNYDSDGHVYGEETRWPDEITREALVWFINVITGESLELYAERGCMTAALIVNPLTRIVPTFLVRTSPDWPIFPWEVDSCATVQK